jgi:hypothetical protein
MKLGNQGTTKHTLINKSDGSGWGPDVHGDYTLVLSAKWRRLWLGCRRCIFGEIVTAGGAWRLQGARSLVSFRGSAVS